MVIPSKTNRIRTGLRISALALLAAAPTSALAQATPSPAPAPATPGAAVTPATPAPSPLAQIPGVTVRYYDVTGITIEAMRASIEAQRPRDEATGVSVPTSATWGIRTNVQRSTTGTQCRVVGATATFQAEVVLPRLATVEGVPAPVLAHWQNYVASLEQQQADRLRQPFQRLSEVERAVMASTCEGASAAANQAIALITAAPPPPAAPTPATPPTPTQ